MCWVMSSSRSPDDGRTHDVRHATGTKSAQTEHTSASTLRSPVGGWGLGMGPAQPPPRIVVTRPTGREAELVARLRERGYEVLHVPLVAVELLGDGPVDVAGYDWVVLTSVTGARELRRRMRGTPRRVAAVGGATAEAFGGADVVASRSTQEGLLEAMPPEPGRVLFAGAEGARRLLPDRLGADVVPLYRTVALEPDSWPDADLVVLASASAAASFGQLGVTTPAVSIGPETTRAATSAGITVVAEARSHDLDGLLVAVEEALTTS